MNIDLSQIIWTIICFALFALVFDRLLLRPVLANIDKRREKLENARGRRTELDETRRNAEEKARSDQAERDREFAKEREERLAAAIEQSDREIEALSAELKEREQSALTEIAAKGEQTDARLASAADDMVAAFSEIITTGGELL